MSEQVTSAARSGSGRAVTVLGGIALIVAGAAAALVMLSQEVGPSGLCGSIFNRQDGGESGPCWDELQSQAITAGLVGGALALVGIVVLIIGVVAFRSRQASIS